MSLDKSHYYFYSIYVFHNIFSMRSWNTIPYFPVSQDFRNRLSALMMPNVFILLICESVMPAPPCSPGYRGWCPLLSPVWCRPQSRLFVLNWPLSAIIAPWFTLGEIIPVQDKPSPVKDMFRADNGSRLANAIVCASPGVYSVVSRAT